MSHAHARHLPAKQHGIAEVSFGDLDRIANALESLLK